MMTKFLIFIFGVLLMLSSVSVQAQIWQPAAGHTQIPIWPGVAPDVQVTAKPEEIKTVSDHLVAGKPWLMVSNVSQPTMTIYSPKNKKYRCCSCCFSGWWL
jgi:hypothetical protein